MTSTTRNGIHSRLQRRGQPWIVSVLLLLSLLAVMTVAEIEDNASASTAAAAAQEDADESSTTSSTKPLNKHVISLAESIRKSQKSFQLDRSNKMKGYWKRTFAEIENVDVLLPATAPLLNEWKLLLDDANATAAAMMMTANVPLPTDMDRPRFDGFRSWDRLLQEWTEDVADYIERKTVESQGYPMSTFGKPKVAVEVLLADTGAGNDDTGNDDTAAADLEVKVEVEGLSSLAAEIAPLSPKQHTRAEEVTAPDPSSAAIVAESSNSNRPKDLPVPRTVQPGEEVVPHTDMADRSKSIWIVTTAALPWMTGTAVNPLLRAAHMTQGRAAAGGKVTLMLPWLEDSEDQKRVYGDTTVFADQSDQEEYVRTWLRETASMEQESVDLNIAWYPAQQIPQENSIYSMGDITAMIKAEEVDIIILEEPEHLNWYRAPGENWTTKFKHVVGIIHTNYFVYAQDQPAAFLRAPGMRLLCSWMCRAHCHRVIKLSGTLGKFAPEKELVENVHGVRGTFLDIGEDVRKILVSKEAETHPVFAPDAEPTMYFIGKMLWSKGLGSLMELIKYAEESAGLKLRVDMYGGGPDQAAADTKSNKLGVDMQFQGPLEHSKLAMSHKIFVNPSTSEVLCTTSSEALAMGKFVVLPSHPSNDFFAQFPNCLPYTNKEEFVGNLYYAMTHSPAPLTSEYAYALSWAAATERLEAAGSISVREAEMMAEAIESQATGVEIDLPPLIDDDEQRRKIVSTFRLSRARYRQFRSKLSEDIKANKVLPKEIQKRMSMELDKRLDVDIDTVLESPKLRFQLSPAELDKRLLVFYNEIVNGPGGDVLRLASGGTSVGWQTLYMKKQAQASRRRERNGIAYDPSFNLPAFSEDDETTDESDRTATQWVTRALRRNLPSKNGSSSNAGSFTPKSSAVMKGGTTNEEQSKTTQMTMSAPSYRATRLPARKWLGSPLI